MTASSSASWSRFSPPSNFVNVHVSTMWFMVCRWTQSQEGDWARPHLCKMARHGPVGSSDRVWRGRWKPGCQTVGSVAIVWLTISCCCWVDLRLQPFSVNISWVQSLQPNLQLGLCTAVDNISVIIWRLCTGHMSVAAARPHFCQQDAQWRWLVRKRFSAAQWCLGRWNPGCWVHPLERHLTRVVV